MCDDDEKKAVVVVGRGVVMVVWGIAPTSQCNEQKKNREPFVFTTKKKPQTLLYQEGLGISTFHHPGRRGEERRNESWTTIADPKHR